jgi:hypothetical protein
MSPLSVRLILRYTVMSIIVSAVELTTLFCRGLFNIKSTQAINEIYLDVEVKVEVTLRSTISRSVRLGVEAHLGLMARY